LISEKSNSESYVARLKDQDVGLISLSTYDDKGLLPLIGLVQDQRGRGFGRHLLNFAIDRFKSLKARRVELAVDLGNKPAVRLYGRAGFQ